MATKKVSKKAIKKAAPKVNMVKSLAEATGAGAPVIQKMIKSLQAQHKTACRGNRSWLATLVQQAR